MFAVWQARDLTHMQDLQDTGGGTETRLTGRQKEHGEKLPDVEHVEDKVTET